MREIVEDQYTTPKIAHLAGIVPIAGKALDFQMPWHDAMMPLAPNYIAAERAILECAWAGCETIWVVCNEDIARVIKNKIGEFVYDPVRSYFKHKMPDGKISTMFKKIPIYYVPVFTKNRAKLSLPYSVIQGAYNAYHASWVLSKWMLPAMYYVAFPYGVYSPKIVSKNRERLSTYTNYLLTNSDGKTVAAMDFLVPGIGELIGGSQREERLDILSETIKAQGLDIANYEWYLDLRRYGSAPHAGFGLGFERLVQYCTGMENIRDVIPFPRYPQHALF